jgi:hypothetical protein
VLDVYSGSSQRFDFIQAVQLIQTIFASERSIVVRLDSTFEREDEVQESSHDLVTAEDHGKLAV